MYKGEMISVIMPAYNEEENIACAISDFHEIDIVDEIIVVDNNSTDRTAEIIKSFSFVEYIKETKQGYGAAMTRGLREAKGDIIFSVEPDGTFTAKDIYKFLQYLEFDVVFGTRTNLALVEKNANMGWFLHWGNIFIGKLLQFRHGGPRLSDVGCSFKMFKRYTLGILNDFEVQGSHFSPVLMMHCIKKRYDIIEIPTTYKKRVGTSKITGETWKAFKLGLRMIRAIL